MFKNIFSTFLPKVFGTGEGGGNLTPIDAGTEKTDNSILIFSAISGIGIIALIIYLTSKRNK